MSIQVTCKCGKRLRVPDAAAGKQGKCPRCGGIVDVPDASRPQIAVSTASYTPNRGARRHTAMWAIGASLMLFGVVAAIIVVFTFGNGDAPSATDHEVVSQPPSASGQGSNLEQPSTHQSGMLDQRDEADFPGASSTVALNESTSQVEGLDDAAEPARPSADDVLAELKILIVDWNDEMSLHTSTLDDAQRALTIVHRLIESVPEDAEPRLALLLEVIESLKGQSLLVPIELGMGKTGIPEADVRKRLGAPESQQTGEHLVAIPFSTTNDHVVWHQYRFLQVAYADSYVAALRIDADQFLADRLDASGVAHEHVAGDSSMNPEDEPSSTSGPTEDELRTVLKGAEVSSQQTVMTGISIADAEFQKFLDAIGAAAESASDDDHAVTILLEARTHEIVKTRTTFKLSEAVPLERFQSTDTEVIRVPEGEQSGPTEIRTANFVTKRIETWYRWGWLEIGGDADSIHCFIILK